MREGCRRWVGTWQKKSNSGGGSTSDSTYLLQRKWDAPEAGYALSVPISILSNAASEDATVQRANVEV
jgi:hypothetical protein